MNSAYFGCSVHATVFQSLVRHRLYVACHAHSLANLHILISL